LNEFLLGVLLVGLADGFLIGLVDESVVALQMTFYLA
jgi:hypothetical protein